MKAVTQCLYTLHKRVPLLFGTPLLQKYSQTDTFVPQAQRQDVHTQTRDTHSVVFSGPPQEGSRPWCPVISIPLQSSDWWPLGWESELPACLTWTGPAFPGALRAGLLSWSPRSWGRSLRDASQAPPPARPPLARPLAAEPGGVAELGLGAPAVAARESLPASRGCGPGGPAGWAVLGFPRRLLRPPWATRTTRGRPPAAPGPAASGGSGGRGSGPQVGAGVGAGQAGRRVSLPQQPPPLLPPPGAWRL